MADEVTTVVAVAIAAPVILAVVNHWFTSRDKRADALTAKSMREEDWARQDAVAAAQTAAAEKAASAASAAAAATAHAAAQASEAAEALRESDATRARESIQTNTKLDVIHGLVNSNLTASMSAELASAERELSLMTEIVDLKQKGGSGPTPVAQRAIDLTHAHINELKTTIADRAIAATAAAKTEDAAAKKGVPSARGQDAA